MSVVVRSELSRAALFLERVNLEVIKAAAARRQRQDQGVGARLPAALAGAPAQLVEVTGGASDPETPKG